MTEDRAADGTCKKSDGVSSERGKRADPRIDVGKELAVEDQGGCSSVDQEVVPFDNGADRACERNGADARHLRST